MEDLGLMRLEKGVSHTWKEDITNYFLKQKQ